MSIVLGKVMEDKIPFCELNEKKIKSGIFKSTTTLFLELLNAIDDVDCVNRLSPVNPKK
jgi:hypothetical protein